MDATHPIIVAEAAQFGKPQNREFGKNACNLLDAGWELASLKAGLKRSAHDAALGARSKPAVAERSPGAEHRSELSPRRALRAWCTRQYPWRAAKRRQMTKACCLPVDGTNSESPRSGRQHKAWGVSPRIALRAIKAREAGRHPNRFDEC